MFRSKSFSPVVRKLILFLKFTEIVFLVENCLPFFSYKQAEIPSFSTMKIRRLGDAQIPPDPISTP